MLPTFKRLGDCQTLPFTKIWMNGFGSALGVTTDLFALVKLCNNPNSLRGEEACGHKAMGQPPDCTGPILYLGRQQIF